MLVAGRIAGGRQLQGRAVNYGPLETSLGQRPIQKDQRQSLESSPNYRPGSFRSRVLNSERRRFILADLFVFLSNAEERQRGCRRSGVYFCVILMRLRCKSNGVSCIRWRDVGKIAGNFYQCTMWRWWFFFFLKGTNLHQRDHGNRGWDQFLMDFVQCV